MNEKEFIKKLVKGIKERYNINEYIGDEVSDWQDDINLALENADIAEETKEKNVYNCHIETRLYNKLIYETFTVEYIKKDVEFKYYY